MNFKRKILLGAMLASASLLSASSLYAQNSGNSNGAYNFKFMIGTQQDEAPDTAKYEYQDATGKVIGPTDYADLLQQFVTYSLALQSQGTPGQAPTYAMVYQTDAADMKKVSAGTLCITALMNQLKYGNEQPDVLYMAYDGLLTPFRSNPLFMWANLLNSDYVLAKQHHDKINVHTVLYISAEFQPLQDQNIDACIADF